MIHPLVEVGELMARRSGSVDPSKFPEELFELHSIPAFDAGRPEFLHGKQIGSAKQIVQPSDVMISKIVPHIRRSSVVGPSSGARQIASGEWIVFRSERIFPHYLRHVLVSDLFHSKFMATVSGVGGSLLRARPAEVAKIKVPLPALPEQRRIAGILDKADALRAKRREAIVKVDQLLQSVFLEMFGNPVRNERGYPIITLAEAVTVGRPITYGILKPGPDIPDGVPYIRVVDIRDGAVLISSVKRTSLEIAYAYRRSAVRAGDVLMSIRGHVGRIGVVPEELQEANITQDTARISVSSSFEPAYIAGLLNSFAIQEHMRRFTRGAAVQGINLKDVREIPVPVPSRSGQARYAQAVQKIAGLKQDFLSQLRQMDEMFAGLQSTSFAGSI